MSVLAHSEPQEAPFLSEKNNVFWLSDGDGSYKLAEELLSLLLSSKKGIIATLDGTNLDREETIETVKERLRLGEEAASKAYGLFTEGSYQLAIEAVTEALQFYSESMKIALEEQVGGNLDVEKTLKAMEFKDAVERELLYVYKVRKTMTQLEDNGFDITSYMAMLEEAEEHLRLAEEMLDDHDIKGAELEESIATEFLDLVRRFIKNNNEEEKSGKVTNFLEETEERLQHLEDRVTNLLLDLAITSEDVAAIHHAFQNIKDCNQEIMSLIEFDEVDLAIEHFDEVLYNVDEVVNIVEKYDYETAMTLRTVEEIEAKSSNLEEETEDPDDSYFGEKLIETNDQLQIGIVTLETDGAEDIEEEENSEKEDYSKNSQDEGNDSSSQDEGNTGSQDEGNDGSSQDEGNDGSSQDEGNDGSSQDEGNSKSEKENKKK